jgi:hypothetical protein
VELGRPQHPRLAVAVDRDRTHAGDLGFVDGVAALLPEPTSELHGLAQDAFVRRIPGDEHVHDVVIVDVPLLLGLFADV